MSSGSIEARCAKVGWTRSGSASTHWRSAECLAKNNKDEVEQRIRRLGRQPFADVLQELRRIADRPSASVVLGNDAALVALRTLYAPFIAKAVAIPKQVRHEPNCRSWSVP